MARIALNAVGLLLSASIASAAPPDITSLFPAGGRVGTTTTVTFQGKLGDGTCQVWYSRPGVQVRIPEKRENVQIEVSGSAEPGICWLRFFNDEGAAALRPFVIGNGVEINEVEPNDDLSKAQRISDLPVVVNGQHGKNGDTDSYEVLLQQGQTLVASLMANRVLGSPQDAVLQVVGPSGFVLEQNEDDHGFDPQLAFTAPATGAYRIRTWAFPATPDSSIRLFGSPACVYRLFLTTGPFVDHLVPAAVQAGLTWPVQVHGWNTGNQSSVNVAVPLSAIGTRFDWPLFSWTMPLPPQLVVETHPTTMEVEPNDLTRPQQLTLPITVTGQIGEPRDTDAFQFSAKKGQRLRFEITARDRDSPLDPLLRLYDSTGKVLKEADDDGKQSADPDTEFAAPADGDYRVAVTDRFLHSGDRHVYLLSITEPREDFALSVSSDVLTLTTGKDLEVPVTVTRTGGFSKEIEIGIFGLPQGVSATTVVSESKGDSSKAVKLVLKPTDALPYSGPIRIWGRSKGGDGFEQLASFPMKALSARTTEFWLIVKK